MFSGLSRSEYWSQNEKSFSDHSTPRKENGNVAVYSSIKVALVQMIVKSSIIMKYAIASENKRRPFVAENQERCVKQVTHAEQIPQETSRFSQERFPLKRRWSEDSTQASSGTEDKSM